MKVLKSTILRKRKCEFGDFELVPEAGWKITQTFIDYESGLLVVSESDENKKNWINEGGVSRIPNRQYIIDSKKGLLLDHNEWKQYFNYKTIETYSEDGKLKLLTTRVHEPERNTDGIEEKLIHVESGQTLSTAKAVAFRKEKRKTLIDSHYESIESAKKYKKQLALGTYPDDLRARHLQELEFGNQVVEYFDENFAYQLTFDKNQFTLGKAPRPKSLVEWNNYSVEWIKAFNKIDTFWSYLTKLDNWFERVKPRKIHSALHYYIITWHNNFIRQHELSYSCHKALNEWMNQCWDESLNRNVYWQFCAHCKSRVYYFPRYPKYACNKCVDLIKDENGNNLNYRKRHELIFKKGDFHVALKESGKLVKLFIGEDEYNASEARFGGIVHQKSEIDL